MSGAELLTTLFLSSPSSPGSCGRKICSGAGPSSSLSEAAKNIIGLTTNLGLFHSGSTAISFPFYYASLLSNDNFPSSDNKDALFAGQSAVGGSAGQLHLLTTEAVAAAVGVEGDIVDGSEVGLGYEIC